MNKSHHDHLQSDTNNATSNDNFSHSNSATILRSSIISHQNEIQNSSKIQNMVKKFFL